MSAQVLPLFPSISPKKTKGLSDPPSHIEVTPEMVAWHKRKALPGDPEDLMEEMLDWHRAKGKRAKDWVACWRNWCRNNARFENRRNGVPKKEQETRLTRSFIEQHARPGETYEAAELRLRREYRVN